MVTDGTDTERTDREISMEEQADASVCYYESGDVYAEDVDQHMAVLPEATTSTAEVTIDAIQICDPSLPLSEE